MITYATLGENLMRQYPKNKKKKSRLVDLYLNPSKVKKLKGKSKRGF